MNSKNILLFGAGKSTTVLISSILKKSVQRNWKLFLADADLHLASSKINHHPNGTAISFDIKNEEERKKWISSADIVISMLPPALHYWVAMDCISFKKNLLTASYLDEKTKLLDEDVKKNGLLFLYEMGLDPGIDHISAMSLIHKIKQEGGTITQFKSHCGGLVSPESDDNPWHYKISWNPSNIVNAGKAGAIYKKNNQIIELDYSDIFSNCQPLIIPGLNALTSYPNRDSLSYIPFYELETATTFIRSTIRHPDFCTGWNYLIKTGVTDTNNNAANLQFKHQPTTKWFNACLNFYTKSENLNDFLESYVKPKDRRLVQELFSFLGLLSNEPVPENAQSPAEILQHLIETKLVLSPLDKDMIVMLHELEYFSGSKNKKIKSSLIVKGEDNQFTAMAKTVGLPIFIAMELILENNLAVIGVHIPIIKEIYEPILTGLEKNGIKFQDF